MSTNSYSSFTAVQLVVLLSCCDWCIPQSSWQCPSPCSCYNRYETMDCRESAMFTVPIANNITKQLYLDDNQLRHLPRQAFASAPNLQLVNLQNNYLTTLDIQTFSHLHGLKVIDVSGNYISLIRAERSHHGALENLTEINLSHNQLQQIPVSLPHFAPRLRKLNLKFNKITSAYFDPSYSILTSIADIDLSGNSLGEITASHLDPLRNSTLTTLSLFDCGLTAVNGTALAGLPSLKQLYVGKNSIPNTDINDMLVHLDSPEALETLDLTENNVRSVTTETFGRFTNLVSLTLSDCNITHIDRELFTNFTRLETLHLQNNALTALQGLSRLDSLRRLNLHNNLLYRVNLTALGKLQHVDVSHNHFASLPYHWLAYAVELDVVDISHNRLRHIDRDAFTYVTVKLLNISYNKLLTLESFGTLKLTRLYASHNLIESIAPKAMDYSALVLEDVDLSYNKIHMLPIERVADNIAMENINLSHNQLGNILLTDRAKTFFRSMSRVQVLDLSYNNITSISMYNFMYLQHLTTLYLRGNRIYDLHVLGIINLFSVAKIDLSHNALAIVDPHIFTNFAYLETVDLSYNPYVCSCANSDFIRWLNSTSLNVISMTQRTAYLCTLASSSDANDVRQQRRDNVAGASNSRGARQVYILDYLSPVDACDTPNDTLRWDVAVFAITAVSVVCAIVLIAFVVYQAYVCHCVKRCHYRWQIRYREVAKFTDQQL